MDIGIFHDPRTVDDRPPRQGGDGGLDERRPPAQHVVPGQQGKQPAQLLDVGAQGRVDHGVRRDRVGVLHGPGRGERPEDVVGPILFLFGPGARFMTGQVLHVNGGGQMP